VAEGATGFRGSEALWRLLRRRGQEATWQAFLDTHGEDLDPEAMAGPLAAAGLQARVALVAGDDLEHLELPTLVQLRDGSWLEFLAREGGRCRLQGPDGSRWAEPAELAAALSGRALDLAPGLPPGASLWQRLKPLFLERPRELLLAGAATLLLQMMGLAAPVITALVMDRALPDGAGALLALVCLGLAAATVQQVVLGWFRDRTLLFLSTRIDASAERGFLEHLLRCPFPFLQQRTLGELMQASAGFQAARDLLPMKTIGVLMDGSMACVYLLMLFLLLPLPALWVLATAVLLALGAYASGRVEAALQAQQVRAGIREHGLLIEIITGVGTLKAAGAEGKALAAWRRRLGAVLAIDLRRGRIDLWAGQAMATVSQGLSLALLVWGGACLLEGGLKIGQLFAFLQLSASFIASLMALVQTGLALMILAPQLAKAEEVLLAPVEPEAPDRPLTEPCPVLMEDVWFRYRPDGPWVLEGYQLRLEPGEKRVLSGPSGAGKTTVLRLLAGLYQPQKGRVLVAGRSPAPGSTQALYLPQFVQIFGGTILDNLRVFSAGASLEALMAASQESGLQELVDTLPMGYQTLLPPGGRSLSGGQRQLIAVTGALAAGRQLLLLDEALANIDPALAQRLSRCLWSRGWTLVSVSHASAEP
jgi:ABC-type bacteriocin/lantibiotic exporter with double-glycine peptidase domain